MGKFLIFSHTPKERGMRRSEVVGTEADVLMEARWHEVLDDEQIYDIVQTDCQESGHRMRQVQRRVNRERR